MCVDQSLFLQVIFRQSPTPGCLLALGSAHERTQVQIKNPICAARNRTFKYNVANETARGGRPQHPRGCPQLPNQAFTFILLASLLCSRDFCLWQVIQPGGGPQHPRGVPTAPHSGIYEYIYIYIITKSFVLQGLLSVASDSARGVPTTPQGGSHSTPIGNMYVFYQQVSCAAGNPVCGK